MGGVVHERYTPVVLAANSTTPIKNSSIGGFLCKTAGTITIVNAVGKTIIDTFPVLAGIYYPTPFYLEGFGTVTTAGGASGTLGAF